MKTKICRSLLEKQAGNCITTSALGKQGKRARGHSVLNCVDQLERERESDSKLTRDQLPIIMEDCEDCKKFIVSTRVRSDDDEDTE